MPNHEQYGPPLSHDEPFQPSPLLPELADFLKYYEYACVMEATDKGTVFFMKAPAADIQSVRGPVPIITQHELYRHPSAPVIRTVIALLDKPDDLPLTFET